MNHGEALSFKTFNPSVSRFEKLGFLNLLYLDGIIVLGETREREGRDS